MISAQEEICPPPTVEAASAFAEQDGTFAVAASGGEISEAQRLISLRRLWLITLCAPLPLIGVQIWNPNTIDPTRLILFAALFLTAATDLRWRKIPNWITYPAAMWILIFNGMAVLVPAGGGPNPLSDTANTLIGLPSAIAGFFVCFFVMFFLFRITGGGAGDVKLAAVIGAALGVEGGLLALAYTYILAAIFALVWIVWTIGPLAILYAVGRTIGAVLLPLWIRPPDGEQRHLLLRSIPLAPFFATGAALAASKLAVWPLMGG